MDLKVKAYIPTTGKFSHDILRKKILRPIPRPPTQIHKLSGYERPFPQPFAATGKAVDLTEVLNVPLSTSEYSQQQPINDIQNQPDTQADTITREATPEPTICCNQKSRALQQDAKEAVSGDTGLHSDVHKGEETVGSSIPTKPPSSPAHKPDQTVKVIGNHQPSHITSFQECLLPAAGASHNPMEQTYHSSATAEESLNSLQKPAIQDFDSHQSPTIRTISPTPRFDASCEVIFLEQKKRKRRIRYGLDFKKNKSNKISRTWDKREVSCNTPNPGAGCANEEETMDLDGCITVSVIKTHAPTKESQPSSSVAPTDKDWGIDAIIGKEIIGGVSFYLVRWKSTLVPEHEVQHMAEQWDIDGEPTKEVVDTVQYYRIHWKPTLEPENGIDAPELILKFENMFKSS